MGVVAGGGGGVRPQRLLRGPSREQKHHRYRVYGKRDLNLLNDLCISTREGPLLISIIFILIYLSIF